MNFNLLVFLGALAAILLLSLLWYFFYNSSLRKEKSKFAECDHNGSSNRLLDMIESEDSDVDLRMECSMGLSNTDDDILEALKHIQPSENIRDLLEKMYEQNGI